MLRRSLAAIALLAAACSATADDDAASDESHLELPACPTDDPTIRASLAKIATVAATCGAVAPPPASPLRPWNHSVESAGLALLEPHHRGRDSFFAAGEAQWALAKFTYGPLDSKLVEEQVDVWVLRGCEGQWEHLGTTTTTKGGEHAAVDGVIDDGARVFFPIPEDKKLGIGRHRIRMVVAGDGTAAEQFVEVLPRGTPIFVSDVDGTLTERKNADNQLVCDEESDFPAVWRAFLEGHGEPNVHEGAPPLYQRFAQAGFRPMYLTARPEWLEPHTRRFLAQSQRGDGRGDLPDGIVHTTLGELGAFDAAAEAFKKSEMELLKRKGFVPTFAFGNRTSDVATYDAYGVPYRFYFENPDTADRHCSQIAGLPELPFGAEVKKGDWRIKSYVGLLQTLGAVPTACR